MIEISAPPNRKPFTDEDGLPSLWLNWFTLLEEYFNSLMATGTTGQRPNPAPFVGFMYFDTTINRPIWAKTNDPTTTWIYADGTNA